MKRTRPVTIAVLWLIAAVAGFVIDLALASSGRPVIVPPATLGIVLAVIAVALLIAAWPVRQAVRGAKRSVDFRHATSVLGLSKASSVVASLAGGWGFGVFLFVVSRPVIQPQSVWMTLVAVCGAVALLVSALIVESWCALPPDDEESATSAAGS